MTNPTLSNFNISAETVGSSTGTIIRFDLNDAADVTIYMINAATNRIVTSLSRNFAAGGTQSVYWNGLWTIGSDTGRKNGSYNVTVVASSGTSTSAADVPSPLIINSVDIHNLTVTPSFDANNNTSFPVTIQYQLAKSANVTLTVRNSTGTIVRTLISRKLQVDESVSTATVTWNGLDDNARSVSIGFYTITVDAADTESSDVAITRTKTVVIESLAGSPANAQKIFEDSAYVYPNPVRNGHAYFRAIPVRDGARIRLKIYTMAGDLVLDRDITTTIPYSWDVTNQSGNKLGRGLYYYVLREEDSLGTLQTIKKMAVIP